MTAIDSKLQCRPELLRQWRADIEKDPRAFALSLASFPQFLEALVHDAAVAHAPRGTDAQILKERELTVSAINGAIAFGSQGVSPAPEGHWLEPFWRIGRALADQGVEATS